MFFSLSSRTFSAHNACARRNILRFVSNSSPITKGKHGVDQIEYIKSIISDNDEVDWSSVRNTTLQIQGSVNEKNLDAVLLKVLVNTKKFDAALSFTEYLKSTHNELNLGVTNGMLFLFHEIGKTKQLTNEQKSFILQAYDNLYQKYKVIDFVTGERLLHALCVINEWKKALKVLEDIKLSNTPSHSSFSSLIAVLFNINKKGEAVKLIARSVSDNRPLQTVAYVAWISYILRKYKENKTKLKYLEDVCLHIFNNSAVTNEKTAYKIKEVFSSLGWNAGFARIRKIDGECSCCHEKLDCLKPTDEEFVSLQNNVKEKLIEGSDLFLKSSPQELKKFQEFINATAPYDVVLDALNIAYVARKGNMERVQVLSTVVNYFVNMEKKILLLGRKHMLSWPKKKMSDVLRKTHSFFTDDLTQDDPYFITAAIVSGSHTDIVSKDLLRGHRFLLKDDKLSLVFRKWQWQHQWMVYINRHRKLIIQPPLNFTPCAQKNGNGWHIPFAKEDDSGAAPTHNDGTPDLSSWLCLRPPPVK